MKEVIISALHYRTPAQKGGLRTWHMANAVSEVYRTTVVTFAVDTLSGERYPGSVYKLWHKQVLKDGALTIYRVNSFPCWRKNMLGRILYYGSASFFQALCLLRIGVSRKIVVVSTHPISLFAASYYISKIFGAKVISDVRDLPFDVAKEISYGLGSRMMSALEALETRCLKGSTAIVCVSKGMLKKIVNKGVDPSNCNYVPIGYDCLDDNDVDRGILELPEKPKLRVVLTGTVGHLIDVGLLVDVASRLASDDRIEFFVAGDGQKLAHWKQVGHDKGARVTFLGRIPKAQISLLCENSDVCMYPLVSGEATATMQGNKIFDYMGAGRPIIYTGSKGDVQSMIEDEKLGYTFEAGDADGVTGLLQNILEGHHSDEMREVGDRCKELAHTKYNSQIIMGQFTKLLADHEA